MLILCHSWQDMALHTLREAFERSVISHMMSDVPYGVLLSGGLDSSLVAAIMSRNSQRRQHTGPAAWPQLHSFSIGLKGSPDLKAAKEVSNYLGTVHHEYVFTIEEALDALPDVIYHLETFDVTTIRASTPMYLMARRISGEGADEIFGGYLYFHKAPNPEEFHAENVRKIKQLHLYDCLRANKAMMAWGVEARVPFLDRQFMEVAMGFNPVQKMCKDQADKPRCEKWILRKAFDQPGDRAYLPPEVLWRQKDARVVCAWGVLVCLLNFYPLPETLRSSSVMGWATAGLIPSKPMPKSSLATRSLATMDEG
eukprot:g4537.t1